ncbi:MAG: aminotransferase class V-fold PLP-dependent enzyme [Gammaproteobacteria bacterium]|jgi:glutamate/tyrosine decarboxylase-like PLP-dependent enzyme|nr:aminotransferase class V-fold PLP-dependent enzyme [Gammaproteobacteria bacterium]
MQPYLDVFTRVVDAYLSTPRPVIQTPHINQLASQLDLELHEKGADLATLEDCLQAYLQHNPDSSQVGFFKQLYAGRNGPAVIGDWIASLSNVNMHIYQVGPVATLMEQEVIKQWCTLVGYKQGDGMIVSGGSQANLIAMMLARHKICPTLKTQGADGRRLRAYVSDQAHYSSQKAANILGLGTDNLIGVASDDQGRLCPQALSTQIQADLALGYQPFYLGLTAGTTVTGAFDPVQAGRQIADQYDLWLHIDGAWGAPVLFSPQHRHLLQHAELSDSFSWDAHKLMGVPLTAAAILVKQAGLLPASCAGGGDDYLFHPDQYAHLNLGPASLQCGRRADALKVWLSWKSLGHQGFAEKVDKLQALKDYCVKRIDTTADLHRLAPAPYLNILFQFKPANIDDEATLTALNTAICQTMAHNGGPFVDYASHKGRSGIRLILANDMTAQEDIDHFLNQCIDTGTALLTDFI